MAVNTVTKFKNVNELPQVPKGYRREIVHQEISRQQEDPSFYYIDLPQDPVPTERQERNVFDDYDARRPPHY